MQTDLGRMIHIYLRMTFISTVVANAPVLFSHIVVFLRPEDKYWDELEKSKICTFST